MLNKKTLENFCRLFGIKAFIESFGIKGKGIKCPKCYSDGVRIRKLTPKECWRLMDFTDEEYEAAEKAGVSKTQLYKQAGNSIVVSVLAGIFNNLLGEQK